MSSKYTKHEKWIKGENIFRKYCEEHGIDLTPPFNSYPLVILNHDFVFHNYEISKSGKHKIFRCVEEKYIELYKKPPIIHDYHYKIMEDRDLINEKQIGFIDHCSFEKRSLYEIKHWKRRPSFGSLTPAQKEVIRKSIGKWKCFIVWVKDDEEIEFIEIEREGVT